MNKKTKRLTIRYLTLKDYEAWVDAYTSMRPPQNRWDEANWEDRYLTRSEYKKILASQQIGRDMDRTHMWAIFRNDDGALIGHMSLSDISRGIFQNGYLGYRIFNPHWGFGYAKEAVKEVFEFGFKKLKLHRIEAGVEPKNIPSIRVAEGVKMRSEGLSKRRLFYKNKWIDLLIYAATSEDFKIKHRFPKAK